jgi:hypothetical protein
MWPGHTYGLDRKLENQHFRDTLRGSGRGESKDNFKIDIAGIDYDDVRWVNLVYNCFLWYSLVLTLNLGLSYQRVCRKLAVCFIMRRSHFIYSRQCIL